MALPLIIAGAAGLLGLSQHASAKEKNEKAQQLFQEAESKYNSTKRSLESSKKTTEETLLKLGNSKQAVIGGSISQFLVAFERVKNVQLSDSIGMNELSKFAIDEQNLNQLRETTNIYSSLLTTGTAGAATGAIIALAASGSLPIVTGTLSVAGTALAAGEIGAAAGLAGSALSFGAAMTPLSAIAAPVILFTGISASMKADENLEKAQLASAKSEKACEKMKVSITICNAITERTNMFDSLLKDLEEIYAPCVVLLDEVTKNKVKKAKGRAITSADFTEPELKLLAVTRALTGAIKSVIDTPILTESGDLSDESQNIYDYTQKALPGLRSNSNEVKSYKYDLSLISKLNVRSKLKDKNKNTNGQNSRGVNSDGLTMDSPRNVAAITIGFLAGILFGGTFLGRMFLISIMVLLLMSFKPESSIFYKIRHAFYTIVVFSFCIHFWINAKDYVLQDSFLGITITAFIFVFIVYCISISCMKKLTEKSIFWKISSVVCLVTLLILIYCFGLGIVWLLCKVIHIPYTIIIVILEIAYFLFALGMYRYEEILYGALE